MLDILFWIAVGAFIGWNVPQPPWALWFQTWAMAKWEEFKTRKR